MRAAGDLHSVLQRRREAVILTAFPELTMFEKEIETALDAVRLAALLCRRVRRDLVTEETIAKLDRSPVTVADYASQAVIIHTLARSFPGDAIVAEEDSSALGQESNVVLRSRIVEYVNDYVPGLTEADVLAAVDGGRCEGGEGRFWTLDPIDGTKGYIRGDRYAVALAMIEDGEVALGVLGCPNLDPLDPLIASDTGCLFHALRGGGAFVRDLETGPAGPITVSGNADPAQAVFCESYESVHSSHHGSGRMMRTLGTTRPPVRVDSQAKYALVACGAAGVYLRLPTRADYEEKIWDHAAGWLLVREAGGRVTDVNGKAIDFSRGRTLSSNSGLVVTNGHLHAAVLDAFKSA